MLTEAGTLNRIADVLDALPKTWQDPRTRADLYHALECAVSLPADDDARCRSWENVRYLTAVPAGGGVHRPLYDLGNQSPDATEPPEFHELLTMLNYAAGWAA